MGLVQLPPSLYQTLDVVDYSAAEQIQNTLYHKFNIEVGDCLRLKITYNQYWYPCPNHECIPCTFILDIFTYTYTPHILNILKWYETPEVL